MSRERRFRAPTKEEIGGFSFVAGCLGILGFSGYMAVNTLSTLGKASVDEIKVDQLSPDTVRIFRFRGDSYSATNLSLNQDPRVLGVIDEIDRNCLIRPIALPDDRGNSGTLHGIYYKTEVENCAALVNSANP